MSGARQGMVTFLARARAVLNWPENRRASGTRRGCEIFGPRLARLMYRFRCVSLREGWFHDEIDRTFVDENIDRLGR